jgi:DNA-binding MarR family transcriptional regulator
MHLVLRVLTTAQALEKAAHRIFKPRGLTPAQFNVLSLLAQQPDGMRASDLAGALIVDPSNVTGLLKRMKRENLLAELENTHDRRQYIVGLSPKGRAVWRKAHREYEKRLAALIAPLSKSEHAAAEKVLQALTDGAADLS